MVTAVKKYYESPVLVGHLHATRSETHHDSYPAIDAQQEIRVHGFRLADHYPFESGEERISYRITPGNHIFLNNIFLPRVCRLNFEDKSCTVCRTSDEVAPKQRFTKLVTEWRKDTGGLSSPRAIAAHPAYKEIIEMGVAALPLIFQDLQKNGGWWYPALRTLTGENPVPKEAKGKPPLNREAWLEWGRRNDYLRQ